MNVSLRKAAALQNAINEALRGISTNSIAIINEFQNIETELANTVAAFRENQTRESNLVNVLYEIRDLVSVANHNAGVNSRLTQIARLDRTIQTYSSLVSRGVRQDLTVLQGQLEKIRTRPDTTRASMYGLNDYVETSILTKEDIAEFRDVLSKAKKAKQKLQDEVLELNVRAEVLLSDYAVSILQAEGLV